MNKTIKYDVLEVPIRGEIFSPERLDQYAVYLAKNLEISKGKKGDELLIRVNENFKIFNEIYLKLTSDLQNNLEIPPAGIWIIDNHFIIEDQIREIRKDLPEKYYTELPKIKNGDLQGYPRIYPMALTLIAHLDSHLEMDTIKSFTKSFQSITPLKMGELWAIPITLRIALVENLRRLVIQIIHTHEIKMRADKLAEKILTNQISNRELPLILNNILNESHISDYTCIAQLSKHLRDHSIEVLPVYEIITNYLVNKNQTIEEVIHKDHLQQAIAQVTIGNIVTSMRLLSSADWQDFFESVSLVESILEKDPSGIYKRMDFTTRDKYRHIIERINKSTNIDEIAIAQEVVNKAQKALVQNLNDDEKSHIGYYLIGKAAIETECHFGCTANPSERFQRFIIQNPNIFYFGILIFIQAFFVTASLLFFKSTIPASLITLFVIISFIPISDTAINILNFIITNFLPPRILPKLELKGNIPDDAKTFIVIPTLFSSKSSVNKLMETLEVHYLSNIDPNLYFAILSDFSDSDKEANREDLDILELADKLIFKLNERYCSTQSPKFYFFHRPRLWNSAEGKWMGWERKRGKLEEFNLFLKTTDANPFIKTNTAKLWDRKLFTQIKYVITLDSDTQIPRESAKKLIGTILHPMNAPRFDPILKKVMRGYAILQPRISVTPTSSSRSFFSQVYSGHTGIDPYTTAVSDAYQDLFGEGSFVGKGLYVIDTFMNCMNGEINENTILSHDLFEGLFAKTALVTDVEFLDDYPSHYDTFARRSHRWIRGDWQIAKWIFPFKDNRFSAISRWKIFDNLRRSLVSPFTLAWIFLSLLLSASPLSSILLILFILFLPAFVHSLNNLIRIPSETTIANHSKNIANDFNSRIIQIGLSILFLPHQSYINIDAIIRTLYRMIISKKRLLEWTTAAEMESIILAKNIPSLNIIVPTESFVVLTVALLISFKKTDSYLVAFPFLALWMLFPYISQAISKIKIYKEYVLSKKEINETRLLARRTWLFFETFVTKLDHWLAPDNFQEDPTPVVAHRTSPTNIGVLLLSTASAYDFGYIGSIELIDRLEKTQETLDLLEKYKGHFYNWYNTTTLEPLYPIYISTVDSGNLASHLITMKNFCLNFERNPIIENQVLKGLQDTLVIIKEELTHINPRYLTLSLTAKYHGKNELIELVTNLFNKCQKLNPKIISDWFHYIEETKIDLDNFFDILSALEIEHGEKRFKHLSQWTSCAVKTIHNLQIQLHSFAPWTESQLQELRINLSSRLPESENAIQVLTSELTFDSEKVFTAKAMPDFYRAKLKTFQDLINFTKEKFANQLIPSELDVLLKEFEADIQKSLEFSLQYLQRFKTMSDRYNTMAMNFDFNFLYNKERKIFTIGYNLSEGRMDNSFYDLLASEARLASFFAIAKGDVPLTHWFHLGRQISLNHGNRALVSWSASMFEYLMPLLIMKNYVNTLLYQTYISVVKTQIIYGRSMGLPWGVSESAYNARDLMQFYQYGPFGIPGMGLKYGLGSDVVISPYSTALAAMIDPKAAMENFKNLKKENAYAKYGFYESIDYTRERLQKGHRNYVIRSFMVHHQGMVLISLNNVLHNNIMQSRFHSDPLTKATELLLQEKIPHHMPIVPHQIEEHPILIQKKEKYSIDIRHYKNISTAFPQTQILSNGSYTVMTTTTGSGFSNCNNIAISRWSEDPTLDAKGTFIYIRDHADNSVNSVSYQPLKNNISSYECSFSEHKIEYVRKDPNISLHTEIIVSPEDNVELRRVTILNNSDIVRNIDLTSYLEPVLTRSQDDNAHLTFSKLFLETEYINSKNALLVHRRKRSHTDKERWGIHVVVTDGQEYSSTEYETERIRFIGRGRSTSNPLVIMENLSLSNTTGTVLDPILSLRKCLTLAPHSNTKVCFASGLAESRAEALRLIDQYHDIHSFDREQELSWTQAQAQLRHLHIQHEDAHLFQELASAILYSNPLMRPISENLQKNQKSQDGLWSHGISGDYPIILVKVTSERDIPLMKAILSAHEYLRLKKIIIDLVIINYEASSYRMSLHDEIVRQTHMVGAFEKINKNGGIFLFNAGTLSEEDNNLFVSFSKVVIDSNKGSLKDQLNRLKLKSSFNKAAKERPSTSPTKTIHSHSPIAIPKLQFFNGLGGFNLEGNEYVIFLNKGQHTPAPWINVIANENNFGFIISEMGNGYTWANNSRENRITPWTNDPVNDIAGEMLYLRDEDTQEIWSPTPGPIRNEGPYLIRHGIGYSQFEYTDHGIAHELTYFTSLKENIKIGRLKIKNIDSSKRRLSSTYYSEWTLGNNRSQSAHYLVTQKATHPNALLAQNPFSNEYHQQIAFCALSGNELTYTCDRRSFLGRNGSYEIPLGMTKVLLDKRIGAGLDPCAAIRSFINLDPGEEKEIIILLGQSDDIIKINQLVEFHLNPKNIISVLNDVKNYWNVTNQTIQIKTPSQEFDILFNRWLIYQTLSCRMWARTALYQSGGAFGFRDQLQDSLGLIYSHPEIARAHIITSANHQFPEGDVQHWWHPPSNKGVRTRFSDDLLWLPYVVFKYISKTQDWSILEENANFVEAPLLSSEQEDLYIQPTTSTLSSSVYDHCIRAIDHSLKIGSHGLPLMGAGDWNDGMNNIGLKGKGESVWVGWFLAKILKDFSSICSKKNDTERFNMYQEHSKSLIKSIEENAWDGKWYLRAFFDDGTPLGSEKNDECKIDSIAQSWATLTGLGKVERQKSSMMSVSEHLILKNEKLCLLFSPPFDQGSVNPGYIKGYPPGIRENGGQYSHAATWTAMAFALLGDGEKAFEILSYINPICRTHSFRGLQIYKVEPYVLSADIYNGSTYSGRGGWSWYTGSSSLFYQAGLEYILGMQIEGDKLFFTPCIPKSWKKFEIQYKWKNTLYSIYVNNPFQLSGGKISMELDGVKIDGEKAVLVDDRNNHNLIVQIE